jgi:MFS family permease
VLNFEKDWSLLAFLSVGTAGVISARYVVPPLLPQITGDLGISPSLTGLVLTISWAAYAFFQYPAGRAADYLTAKTVLIGGLLMTTIGAVLMIFSTTYATFTLAMLAMGIGSGLYLPGLYAVASEEFPDRTGFAFGVISASINVGGTIAPGLAVVAVAIAIWRLAYLPIIALLLVVAVIFHRSYAEPYSLSRVELDLRETIGRLFGDRRIRWTLVAAMLLSFVWQGFLNFLPTFLQFGKGFPPYLANGIYASMFVIGIFINPITGRLGDERGYFTIIIGMGSLACGGIVTMVVADPRSVALVGALCSTFGLVGIWPAVNTYFIEQFPDASYAGDFGAVRATFLGFGSLGPTFVGGVAESFDYVVAFAGLFAVLLCSLLIWIHQSRRF